MQTAEERLIDLVGIPVSLRSERVNGHILRYAVAGKGPPLVMIHGLNLGWGQWHPNIVYLAERFTLYLVDLPGSGFSSELSFLRVDFVRDYIETVEAFVFSKKLGAIQLLGHSLGGWVAFQMAYRKKVSVRSVVLVAPLGFSRYLSPNFYPVSLRPMLWLLTRFFVKPTRENLRMIITQPLKKNFQAHENFVDYYCESVQRRGHEAHPFHCIHRMCSPFRVHEELLVGDAVLGISQPVLVILGTQDPLIVPEKNLPEVSRIPGVVVQLFDTGHVPMMEEPRETNKLVRDFFIKNSE